MFTGLIKTQGEIRRVDQRGDRMITIAMQEPFPIEIGDSVSCNGICLTVVKINGHEFKVSLSAETLNCSTSGDWAVGKRVNLEPSLRVGDSVGGHFVAGHVDGMATVIAQEISGDSMIFEFQVPETLAKFIAPKGSIAIDGVSLTINQVTPTHSFTVNIIAHTNSVTNFKNLAVGHLVNIEVDMLARYVARVRETA